MDVGRTREKRQERLPNAAFLDHDTHVYIGYDLGNWNGIPLKRKKRNLGMEMEFLVWEGVFF